MKRLKRRAAVSLGILVLMLAAASYCIIVKKDAPRAMRAESTAVMAAQDDLLTRFRTEREALRSRQIGQLNDIIHSEAADGDTVNRAQRQLMDLMKVQEAELRLESLLRLRGFEDALVTVGDASVNVVLRAQQTTRQESAIILDLVLRETGVTAGNVKILTINP